MATDQQPAWRFVFSQDTEREEVPGRVHHWHCKPEMVKDANLLMVQVEMPPGGAHRFHYHPHMEEILYFLKGKAEQWVEKNYKTVGPGDSVYIPAGMVHATFNPGDEGVEFLAILSPANNPGPPVVEIGDQEPWKSLRS